MPEEFNVGQDVGIRAAFEQQRQGLKEAVRKCEDYETQALLARLGQCRREIDDLRIAPDAVVRQVAQDAFLMVSELYFEICDEAGEASQS